ncbi:MAG: hypothetical protein U9N59_01175 [Campylobacterota bacterium]|nr:hypothetical protein [Campylobacterota bacterium]
MKKFIYLFIIFALLVKFTPATSASLLFFILFGFVIYFVFRIIFIPFYSFLEKEDVKLGILITAVSISFVETNPFSLSSVDIGFMIFLLIGVAISTIAFDGAKNLLK